MKEAFEKWAFKKAVWWQFWRPQSGLAGGLMFGSIFAAILLATLWS